jgi:hypothetical protein
MVARAVNNALPEVLLCRQRVSLEVNGISQQLHMLYNWGATITLITHEAAKRTGLQPIQQQRKSVLGLKGVKIASTCFYMVPMVDCDEDMQVIIALGVTRIAWMDKGTLPPEMRTRVPRWTGEDVDLRQDQSHVDLLLGQDNGRWLPTHLDSSELPFDNLRLMMSRFDKCYILMGSAGREPNTSLDDGSENNWENAIRDLRLVTGAGDIFRGVMAPVAAPQEFVGATAPAPESRNLTRAAAPANAQREPVGVTTREDTSRSFMRRATPAHAP